MTKTIDGARLRMERIAQDMTQKQLAEKAQLATMTVNRYETKGGPIRESCLELLAKALNVGPEWLCEMPSEAPSERPSETLSEAITEPGNTETPKAQEALSNGRRMR